MQSDQILMYQNTEGETAIDVKITDDTVWLNQYQLAELFKTDRTSIVKHIRNIYKSGELNEELTCANFAQVKNEGARTITRSVAHYNLDLIISVGYRVNSKSGVQFRIWANRVLKEYLVKGYAVNEKLLQEKTQQLNELKHTVKLLSNVASSKVLTGDEASGLLKVVTDYAYALDILDKYDHQQLVIEGTTSKELFIIDYMEAKQAIYDLKEKFGGSSLFGNEKDESFKSSIGTIYQTFGGLDYILVWKKRLPISYISWLKTILFLMVINELLLTFCLVFRKEWNPIQT